jgi:hypothetical protein
MGRPEDEAKMDRFFDEPDRLDPPFPDEYSACPRHIKPVEDCPYCGGEGRSPVSAKDFR